jgi:FSR family fosmidomycin resistance protein-like MFS transporter
MGAGILLTGIGISSIGFIENYWGIFAVVMLAGFGSALFHPEGGRMASSVAGDKKGQAMSNFTVGGNIGFVIGPVVVATAVPKFGLRATAIAIVPAVIMSAVLFSLEKRLKELSDISQKEILANASSAGNKDEWKAFITLCLPIFMRSIMQSSLQTFIPLYWISVLSQTQRSGSLMVTLMSLASAVAAFTGGRLADHFGFRRVIRTAFATVIPLTVLLLMTKNIALATMIVVLLVAMNQMGHSPSVALGQKYLPNHVGLASGVTIGLSVSIGGICSPVLGRVGDIYGLTSTLYVLSGVALCGFLGTLLIRKPADE